MIIPDYRLVPHVIFPAPAEDLRDAIRWVLNHKDTCLTSETTPNVDVDKITLMGHSAGAAHIATMLFMTAVLPQDDVLRQKIQAAILESPPFDLSTMTPEWPMACVHAAYWGTLEKAKFNDPLSLFKRLDKKVLDGLPKMLMVEAEFEPDWLLEAGKVFNKEVLLRKGKEYKVLTAKGHNHVSLNWALSTGEGEEWAGDVLQWLEEEESL